MTKLSSFLLGNKFIGIEYFTQEGNDCYDVVEIKQKKNELVISNHAHLKKIEDLSIDDSPSYLAVNTNQVLYKEIDSVDSNDLKLLQKAFPNLNVADFYFEIWRLEHKAILFICRKEYVNGVIKSCRDHKINLIGFSLGVASLSKVIPFLKEDFVRTGTFSLDFTSSDKILTAVADENSVDYHLNGLQVNSKSIVSFATVLGILLKGNQTSGNVQLENKIVEDTFFQSAFFSKGSKVMIGFVLCILLINFFVFSHYFKKGQEVSESLEINKSSIERINKLKEDIKNKEERVKSFAESNASKSSLILNEIAQSVPTSIVLDQLVYNPFQKRVKPNEQLLTESNTILLSGSSIDKADFTSWITYLETLTWISSVAIANYGSENGKAASFEIKIKWNDEIEQKK